MADSPLEGIRLVALDLDGTLLPSDKRLTERGRRVIRGLLDAGIDVTLATGRGWTSAATYGDDLELTAALVTVEGAFVARRGDGGPHPLSHRTVAQAARRAVHEVTEDLSLGFFYYHDGHRTRAHRWLEDRVEQIRIWGDDVDVVEEALHDHDDDAFIVHLVGEEAPVVEAWERIASRELPGVELHRFHFWDGYHQLQIRPTGVGKHTGLGRLLDDHGLHASEVLACGDWWNDLEMLRMAGVAVAPANAEEGIRAEADHVLPGTCDDDAVPRFLEDALESL